MSVAWSFRYQFITFHLLYHLLYEVLKSRVIDIWYNRWFAAIPFSISITKYIVQNKQRRSLFWLTCLKIYILSWIERHGVSVSAGSRVFCVTTVKKAERDAYWCLSVFSFILSRSTVCWVVPFKFNVSLLWSGNTLTNVTLITVKVKWRLTVTMVSIPCPSVRHNIPSLLWDFVESTFSLV